MEFEVGMEQCILFISIYAYTSVYMQDLKFTQGLIHMSQFFLSERPHILETILPNLHYSTWYYTVCSFK